MGVAFFEAGASHSDETRLRVETFDGCATREPHAGAQPADELGQLVGQRPFVGNHPLDTFRHQFGFDATLLEVPVTRSLGLFHGAYRAHPSIGLEGPALVQDLLAGRLFDAGEERTDHDHIGARRESLGNVAGKADTSIGDHRNTVLRSHLRALHNRGNLRHPSARHHPGRTDRAWSDADLECVRSQRDEFTRRFPGGDISYNQRGVREFSLDPLRHLHHASRVGMRTIEAENVDLTFDQGGAAFGDIVGDTDPGRHPQPAELILAGVGVVVRLLDVLDGDQTLEIAFIVDHKELLDSVLVEEHLGLVECCTDRGSHQIVLGHKICNGTLKLGAKPQVTVGQNALELALDIDNRQTRNAEACHHIQRLAHRLPRLHRHRIDNHSGLRSLDSIDFFGVPLDGHVFVNNAETAVLGHRNCHVGLGHGVHCRRNDGQVEAGRVPGHPGRYVDGVWMHL